METPVNVSGRGIGGVEILQQLFAMVSTSTIHFNSILFRYKIRHKHRILNSTYHTYRLNHIMIYTLPPTPKWSPYIFYVSSESKTRS